MSPQSSRLQKRTDMCDPAAIGGFDNLRRYGKATILEIPKLHFFPSTAAYSQTAARATASFPVIGVGFREISEVIKVYRCRETNESDIFFFK